MAFFRETHELRSFAAVCCAFVATVLFLVQRHVVFHLAEPSTYGNVFHHKCGLLLVACLGWALLEGTHLALSGRGISPS